jgi:Leucine-rich repeat (LRR) protein
MQASGATDTTLAKRSRADVLPPPDVVFEYDCSIPLEIFAHICTFLKYGDVVAFVSTCKYLRRLIHEKYLALPIFVCGTYPMPPQINPRMLDLSIKWSMPGIQAFFDAYAPVIYRMKVSAMTAIPDLPPMPKLLVLKIVGQNITRLPVAPELYQCIASYSAVIDISALADCRDLRVLDLTGTPVMDITPLANCHSLKDLNLPISCMPTLAAIKSLPQLRQLSISRSDSDDTIAIPDLPKSLETLCIDNPIINCKNLAGLVNLQVLQISSDDESLSLNFVKLMAGLKTLYIRNATVADLNGLASCPALSRLQLFAVAPDVDVSMLTACLQLTYVDIMCIGPQDIAFRLANLRTFKTYSAPGSSISGIRYSPRIILLDICRSWITHLPAGTWSANLRTLNIADTLVADITGLIAPRLRGLNIANTQIADISAITGCPKLQKIDISATYVADIQPMLFCANITHISATQCKSIRVAAVVLQLPRLRMADFTECKIANAAGLAAALTARGVDVQF